MGDGAASRRRRRPSAPAFLTLPATLVATTIALPIVYIGIRAFQRGWPAYRDIVFTPLSRDLLIRTVALTAGVVAVATVIALVLAWLVARTDLPGRRLWAVAAALPLVVPSYVAALCLVSSLGPRGFLQQALAPLGVDRLPALAYGYSGALLALALFTYPYIYLPLVAAFRDLDPALEESARALGAGPWRTFFTVTLPQLRPALAGGTLIVALYSLSDFGAVSIARYGTFTLGIYNAYRGRFDRTAAAALATVLVLLTVGIVVAVTRLSRRLRPVAARPARPAPRVRLGRWRWPGLFAVGAVAVINLVLPTATIVFWAVRGFAAGSDFVPIGRTIAHSLSVALTAAFLAGLMAFPIAAWSARYGSPAARAVERLTYAGFALPGLVIALALVFFSIRFVPALYQSLPLLALAYVVRFLPESATATRASLARVSPTVEEAARNLGRGPAAVLRTITLPLVWPGVLAGVTLVFLTTMKELPATLLLRPTGFDTLATEIWSYASETMYGTAALPALALLVFTAPPIYLLTIRPALASRKRIDR